jgi:O-acetyl-ADP-ribose deacetylase (regulator of RNase III)
VSSSSSLVELATGNLLEADTEALVNTVNEVGVMGKGIALMFRDRFPTSSRRYVDACRRGEVRVGRVLPTETGELFPRWVIHFPTKRHWRSRSSLQWIKDGLRDLIDVVHRLEIRSIAIPPLGCGNGGLDWRDVRPLIERSADAMSGVEVVVFPPTNKYMGTAKPSGLSGLTPARSLITELARVYSDIALDCTLIEIQKLAYFLQRAISRRRLVDPLALSFSANRYGPYADQLRHLIDALDGSYLRSERRIGDANPRNSIWFASERAAELREFLARSEMSSLLEAVDDVLGLIRGFESSFGLELLATVDWLVTRCGYSRDPDAVLAGIGQWPGGPTSAERKARIMNRSVVVMALDRLRDSGF